MTRLSAVALSTNAIVCRCGKPPDPGVRSVAEALVLSSTPAMTEALVGQALEGDAL